MKKYPIKFFFVLFMCLICPQFALAEIEWETQQIINFDETPVDMVMSARGTYLFVLTDDGVIHVYDSTGNLKGQVEAGKGVDKIACGPSENQLILKYKKNKEIKKIVIDFIQDIDIEGSPYKGNKNAPVVIAVFTDYQ